MKQNCYVDFHVLQTVPPSCINRDDTGSPKTAVFGGKTRARVSSQAWKHAMRETFKTIFAEEQLGYRTRNVKQLLIQKLQELDPSLDSETEEKIAAELLESSKIKSGGDKKDVLFFISASQVNSLAQAALDVHNNTDISDKEKKALYKKALTEQPGFDLVLFGRMAANDPSLNYDAAAQVAHAISTHAVSTEYDYYTAVDDFSGDDSAGAGHLGTIEFNSSTLYRYASVNVCELMEHLDETETIMAVKGFAEAFFKSMPTGKQNSFANRTFPDMVYVTIRKDQPVNLVNAFEMPIRPSDNGYINASKKALVEYADSVYKNWGAKPENAWCIGCEGKSLGKEVDYSALLDELENAVKETLDLKEGM